MFMEKQNLSSNKLKLIAIYAMLIDHIAWKFVPMESFLGQAMHFIGRVTMPIMCYFIVEGYYHTKNLNKYILRLGIFAIISHIPFLFFESGKWIISIMDGKKVQYTTSVIYTLFLGLISLAVWNEKKLKYLFKVGVMFVIFLFSSIGDWGGFGVLWILGFGINYGDFRKQITNFILISASLVILTLFTNTNVYFVYNLYIFGVFLAIPFLKIYNGKLGRVKNFKWAFYIFYPVHLLILALIKYGL